MSKRVGTVVLDMDGVNAGEYDTFLERMRITGAVQNPSTGTIRYEGTCELFRDVREGGAVPEYEVEMLGVDTRVTEVGAAPAPEAVHAYTVQLRVAGSIHVSATGATEEDALQNAKRTYVQQVPHELEELQEVHGVGVTQIPGS